MKSNVYDYSCFISTTLVYHSALLTRYSQGVLKESYSSSEVVLVGEMMKLVVSAYLTLNDTAQTGRFGCIVIYVDSAVDTYCPIKR